MVNEIIGYFYDLWSKIMGHKIYDTLQLNDEPYKQLFCTCGGRIFVAPGNNKFYWTVIESSCPAVRMFAIIFSELRADFPRARTVKWRQG